MEFTATVLNITIKGEISVAGREGGGFSSDSMRVVVQGLAPLGQFTALA